MTASHTWPCGRGVLGHVCTHPSARSGSSSKHDTFGQAARALGLRRAFSSQRKAFPQRPEQALVCSLPTTHDGELVKGARSGPHLTMLQRL